MDEAVARDAIGHSAQLRIVRHPVNYVTWARVSAYLQAVRPRLLSRLLIACAAIGRSAVNTRYLSQVLWIAIRHRVHLIHLNNGLSNQEANAVAAILRLPAVVHEHGITTMGKPHAKNRWNPGAVIAISRIVADSVANT